MGIPQDHTESQARDTLIYVGAFELPDGNAAAQRVRAVARLFHDQGVRVVLVGRSRDPALGPGDVRRVRHEDIPHDCWETGYPRSKREWLTQITTTRALHGPLAEAYGDRLLGVIAYNFPALAQRSLASFARRLGGQALADVTEWYGTRRMGSINAVVKNLDTWLRMHWVNPGMDALITTSPYLSDVYRDRVRLMIELPTLIDPGPDRLAPPDIRAEGPIRLFFAGSGFDPVELRHETEGLKDRIDWVVELLGRAVEQGADFTLDAFGLDEAAYLAIRPDHADIVTRLGRRLRFHGRRPRPEVLDALQAADYAIFLRKKTRTTQAGFPTKFAEAITYGTPVLTNRMDNIAPYLIEEQTGYHLDIQDRDAALATFGTALAQPAPRLTAMKRTCHDSGLFAPAAFATEAGRLVAGLRTATASGRVSGERLPHA